jgi:hypothetical protein
MTTTIKTLLAAAALALPAIATAAGPAAAATISQEGDALVVRGTAAGEDLYLDDSYGAPDPAQVLRIDGDAVFTAVPASCAQRDTTMVDCPAPARLRVELGGGNDRFGILNQLSVELDELVVDGGDGSDALTGDHVFDRSETLIGGAGADHLDGMGGDDVLRGGPGDDVLDGKAGNDQVLGEDGNDELAGDGQAAPGTDLIDGGAGSDILKDYTEHGTDLHPPANVSLNGAADDGRSGEGDNVVGIERYIGYVNGDHVLTDGPEDWQVWSNVSSGGASTVRALGGNDRVVGQDAQEIIDGGAGDDYLEGGKNHDTLIGGPGKDIIFGDETDSSCNSYYPESCVRYGNDIIEARDGEADQVDCGPGADRAVVDPADVVAANCEIVERGTVGGDGPGTGPPAGPGVTLPPGAGGKQATKKVKRFTLVGAPRLRAALRTGLALRLTGAKPGKAKIVARQGRRTVASGRVTVRRDGTATLRVRFTKAAVRRLARSRKVTLTVIGAGLSTTLTIRR